MFELEGRKNPHKGSRYPIEGDDVLCYLKWWKRIWDWSVIFSVTQTAAV